VIVVHGALRDSDRYLASAQHAARLIRLTGVGHTAADVLAAERTREIVFAGRRGQPRA
jgi:diadenosine tetraphosphatase ApaH/serine/threonine PP2A family protein phosphatase